MVDSNNCCIFDLNKTKPKIMTNLFNLSAEVKNKILNVMRIILFIAVISVLAILVWEIIKNPIIINSAKF